MLGDSGHCPISYSCCMPGPWPSTSVHCSHLLLPSFWFRPLGPFLRGGAQLATSSPLCHLSHWCKSSTSQWPQPTRCQGQREWVQASAPLTALPMAPSSAPGAHPETECFPLHHLESLRACPAPSSVVRLLDFSGGREFGNAPGGLPPW